LFRKVTRGEDSTNKKRRRSCQGEAPVLLGRGVPRFHNLDFITITAAPQWDERHERSDEMTEDILHGLPRTITVKAGLHVGGENESLEGKDHVSNAYAATVWSRLKTSGGGTVGGRG